MNKNHLIRRTLVSILVVVVAFCTQENALAFSLEGTIFEQVGHEANIDPALLYAIALCESGFNPASTKTVSPHPWTLRLPQKPIYTKTKKEALEQLHLILKTTPMVDVGLMQINWYWHSQRVHDADALLDPVTNLRIAAQILNENFAKHPTDAIKAIGLYHSHQPERAVPYSALVWRVFLSLKRVPE